MTWVQTYTGEPFDLINPDPQHVNLEDIAHSLGFTCRFNGHTNRFYSNAEHSWWVHHQLAKTYPHGLLDEEHHHAQAWALLHDAAEAYIGDISKPMKAVLGDQIKVIEQRVQVAIANRFALPDYENLPQVGRIKEIDFRMLTTEAEALLVWPPKRSWTDLVPGGDPVPMPPAFDLEFNYWPPSKAKVEFLKVAAEIGLK